MNFNNAARLVIFTIGIIGLLWACINFSDTIFFFFLFSPYSIKTAFESQPVLLLICSLFLVSGSLLASYRLFHKRVNIGSVFCGALAAYFLTAIFSCIFLYCLNISVEAPFGSFLGNSTRRIATGNIQTDPPKFQAPKVDTNGGKPQSSDLVNGEAMAIKIASEYFRKNINTKAPDLPEPRVFRSQGRWIVSWVVGEGEGAGRIAVVVNSKTGQCYQADTGSD